MKRYHPLLVALHWIVAIMILMSLLIGGPMLADIASTDPTKIANLGGHMVWGLVIGTLLIVRLVVRMRSQKPPAADAGSDFLNLSSKAAHWGLYIVAFAMVASGLATALSAGLFGITLGGNGEPLPADLTIYPPRVAHGVIAYLLLILVGLHVVGWAFHQFVRKDKLFSRMWFGKRSND